MKSSGHPSAENLEEVHASQESAKCPQALLTALNDQSVLSAFDGAAYEDVPCRRAPPAVHAPKGLRGIFRRGDSGAAYEPMDVDVLPPSSVILNVYDVGDEDLIQKINRYSTVSDKVLIGGVYHVGVQVYGREWGYGGTDVEGVTGVCDCPPRLNWQHTYKCTIDLGSTSLSEEEVSALLLKLKQSPMWEGINYDLLHNNCLHFANLFCNRLGVRRLPGWLDRFGRAAVNLQSFSENVAAGVQRTKQIARSLSTEVGSAVHEAKREAPSIVEAGTSRASAIGTSVARWGQGLLAAATRSLGDDPASKGQRKQHRALASSSNSNDLRASLRNRGGINVSPGSPAPAQQDRVLAPDEKQEDRQCEAEKARTGDDPFLLLEQPAEAENYASGCKEG